MSSSETNCFYYYFRSRQIITIERTKYSFCHTNLHFYSNILETERTWHSIHRRGFVIFYQYSIFVVRFLGLPSLIKIATLFFFSFKHSQHSVDGFQIFCFLKIQQLHPYARLTATRQNLGTWYLIFFIVFLRLWYYLFLAT